MKGAKVWEQPCYERVPVAALTEPNSTHYVSFVGNSVGSNFKRIIGAGSSVGTPLALSLISPLFGAFAILLEIGVDKYQELRGRERERLAEIWMDVFPIKWESDIGIGAREAWMSNTGVTNRKLSAADFGSSKPLLAAIARGYKLCKAQTAVAQDRPMNLSNDLFPVGGPIPNGIVRNTMYDPASRMPFRFRLDVAPDLAAASPLAIKELSNKPKRDWYICDAEGTEVPHGVPVTEDGRFVQDSFIIAKVPSPFSFGFSREVVIVSGCHALGTAGAGLAMTRPGFVRDFIYRRARSEPFAMLGTVRAKPESGEPDPETLRPVDILPLTR